MEEKVLIKTNNKHKIGLFWIWSVVFFFVSWIIFDIGSSEDTMICLLESGEVTEWTVCVMLFSLLIALIPLLFFIVTRNELIVTDKRIYGKTVFGRRVDLPLDSITAVALTMSLLKGISVSTSSGRITFYFLENSEDFHKVISDLIINRQSLNSEKVFKTQTPQSNADELKKYKDLLDSGVITQEEFDKKKQQLLDL